MSFSKNQEFQEIVKDILDNKEFQMLNSELHHGISRYGHSLRVAKSTYKFAKRFHLNYVDATRAALLHDFFFDDQLALYNNAQTWCKHPIYALENSVKYFSLNEMQKNAIVSHMFPSCKVLPKYRESWLITCVDKGVSFYEMYRFKASLVLGVWAMFVFNMITLQK